MATAGEAMGKLDAYAQELDGLSRQLTDLERQLVPVQEQYEQFIADYEIGCWTRHVDGGAKLPAKDLRVQLAHKEMDGALLGRYVGLTKSRDRMMERIATLKKLVEAQRSILSALKEELAATR